MLFLGGVITEPLAAVVGLLLHLDDLARLRHQLPGQANDVRLAETKKASVLPIRVAVRFYVHDAERQAVTCLHVAPQTQHHGQATADQAAPFRTRGWRRW